MLATVAAALMLKACSSDMQAKTAAISMTCNSLNVLLSHHETVAVHLLLQLLPKLLLGLLKLLVSELGDFSNHLASHCYQRSILHALIAA